MKKKIQIMLIYTLNSTLQYIRLIIYDKELKDAKYVPVNVRFN